MSDDLTKQEFIKLLKEEDKIFREEKEIEEKKRKESELLRLEIFKKEREAEAKQAKTNKLEEEKNNVLLQRYATEASIYKNELEQIDLELEEINKQLTDLLAKSKVRIDKISDQFLLLNKQKNFSLDSIDEKSDKPGISNEIKDIVNNET